jgi:hypothetical protein
MDQPAPARQITHAHPRPRPAESRRTGPPQRHKITDPRIQAKGSKCLRSSMEAPLKVRSANGEIGRYAREVPSLDSGPRQ